MKKLFTIIALASISYASAQITTNAGTFNKPTAGDTAFEMKFMPNLDGTAMFAESTSGTLMMRSFKSETQATRLSVNLEIVDTGVDGMDTAFAVGLGYGIENHFSGAERLSTYWGYQGSVGFADDGTDDAFTVGAGVFLGADYYIIPKVYIGTEIGYGLGIISADDTAFALDGSVTGMLRLGFRL
ncbi:MAG: hypothetical protein P8P55_07935 [Flavobacteriaceae bacterium]|nr:hypothetical protein [Flavobacteriaceae bacterium]